MAGRIVVIFGMIIGAWVGGMARRTGKQRRRNKSSAVERRWNTKAQLPALAAKKKKKHIAKTPGSQLANRSQCYVGE